MTIEAFASGVTLDATMPCKDAAQLRQAGLAAALSYLEVGETFELVLWSKPDPATREQVGVRAFGFKAAEAPLGAQNMATSGLRFAGPALQFAPAKELNLEPTLPFNWRLTELSDESASRTIGFGNRDDVEEGPLFHWKGETGEEGSVRMEQSRVWTSIDDCLAALLTTNSHTEIRLTWCARAVPAERVDPLRGQRCAQPKLGLGLDVSVHSQAPLPMNLLTSIGQIAYETSALHVSETVTASSVRAAAAGAFTTVLRSREAAPPAVLPSPEFLIGAGVAKRFPDAPAGLPSQGTPIGVAQVQGQKRTVIIPERERSRHTYLVGSTGSGKTTMLLEMIMGDISKGSGVLMIDPHGDLYDAVKARFPWDRRGDLVLLDAANTQHPFALNALAVHGLEGARASTFITNELMAIFSSIYDMKVVSGPMFEQYFSAAMSLIMTSGLKNPTLSDLARVFEDPVFRRQCLEDCTDDATRRFWKQTALRASGEASLENIAPYIFSKVNRFLDGFLKPVLASKDPGINFSEAMDQKKVVLVNLAKGQIGAPSARFLGMVLLMRLLAATLGRGKLPEAQREPFFVYADEFQSLATESAGTFLAEGRKFQVCMTLASQTLSQLSIGGENLADTVVANCGTMIMTRLGPNDADRLARTYGPTITPSEMQSLPAFHAVGSFMAREVPPTPFVFRVPQPAPTVACTKPVVDGENDDGTLDARVAL